MPFQSIFHSDPSYKNFDEIKFDISSSEFEKDTLQNEIRVIDRGINWTHLIIEFDKLTEDQLTKLETDNTQISAIVKFPETRYRRSFNILDENVVKIPRKRVYGTGDMQFKIVKKANDGEFLNTVAELDDWWTIKCDYQPIPRDVIIQFRNFLEPNETIPNEISELYKSNPGAVMDLDISTNELPVIYLDSSVDGFEQFLKKQQLRGKNSLIQQMIYLYIHNLSLMAMVFGDLANVVDIRLMEKPILEDLSQVMMRRLILSLSDIHKPEEVQKDDIIKGIASYLGPDADSQSSANFIRKLALKIQDIHDLKKIIGEFVTQGI